MFVNWLRMHTSAAAVLAVIRIYLGYSWLMAGIGKLGGFEASGFLKGAIGKSTGDHPAVQGWWATFLENFALPNVGLFNFLIPWGEVLVGIALILGIFTTFSALMGIIMNFAFMFSGTTSTNPQMVLLTIFILVAGANAGKFGLDRFVLPFFRKKFSKRHNHDQTISS